MSCPLTLSKSDFSEPLLPQSLHEEDEEEEIILLEINESGEADGESMVLIFALYVLFFLQYFFLFQHDYDSGLEPMVVYGTIFQFALASYLYNGVISTASTSFSEFLQFVPEVIIVSSMALTFALECAIPGFLWLVAGTCGLATVVVVFHALQLFCPVAQQSETNAKSLVDDDDDDDDEESIV